jgi:hypothetical protein
MLPQSLQAEASETVWVFNAFDGLVLFRLLTPPRFVLVPEFSPAVLRTAVVVATSRDAAIRKLDDVRRRPEIT